MSAVAARIAAAPVSWGVCEVPGWGHQLELDVVLAQMAELGLTATEFGPEGFLPDEPDAKVEKLSEYDLRAVGQFVPVVLHDPRADPLPEVQRSIDALVCAQADTIVIAAVTGLAGYDERPPLTHAQWVTCLNNLDRIDRMARERGLQATVHPHVGTIIEDTADIQRVLDGSDIALCLDTGHLLVGGVDPLTLVDRAPERIGHVHLKDVRLDLATAVREGRTTYTNAVRAGMYVPLGCGEAQIDAIVQRLEACGYGGWYVLEQDTILNQSGAGDPIDDVARSMNYLIQVVLH